MHMVQLPSDEELRRACPPVWRWYDDFPHEQHRIYSRLHLAYVRRLAYLLAPPGGNAPRFPQQPMTLPALLQGSEAVPPPYWGNHKEDFKQLCKEIRDLLTRLHPVQTVHPLISMSNADRVLLQHTTQALRDQGLLEEEIKELVEALTKGRVRVGAATHNRITAVKALELKHLHPEYSYRQITDKFCRCGAEHHHKHCRERMRKGIAELRKALTQYAV